MALGGALKKDTVSADKMERGGPLGRGMSEQRESEGCDWVKWVVPGRKSELGLTHFPLHTYPPNMKFFIYLFEDQSWEEGEIQMGAHHQLL